MLKFISALLIFGTFNCAPKKEISSNDAAHAKTEAKSITPKQMEDKGFSKGTIVVNKSKDCPYVLTIGEYKDKLDPINLDEFFKNTAIPEKVWVTYANLRMPNRCSDARPVTVTAIEKRVE